jgi:hypothetical protein
MLNGALLPGRRLSALQVSPTRCRWRLGRLGASWPKSWTACPRDGTFCRPSGAGLAAWLVVGVTAARHTRQALALRPIDALV